MPEERTTRTAGKPTSTARRRKLRPEEWPGAAVSAVQLRAAVSRCRRAFDDTDDVRVLFALLPGKQGAAFAAGAAKGGVVVEELPTSQRRGPRPTDRLELTIGPNAATAVTRPPKHPTANTTIEIRIPDTHNRVPGRHGAALPQTGGWILWRDDHTPCRTIPEGPVQTTRALSFRAPAGALAEALAAAGREGSAIAVYSRPGVIEIRSGPKTENGTAVAATEIRHDGAGAWRIEAPSEAAAWMDAAASSPREAETAIYETRHANEPGRLTQNVLIKLTPGGPAAAFSSTRVVRGPTETT